MQINESFLILIKAKFLLLYDTVVNPSLTKLVRSRWLEISLVLFLQSMKKGTWPIMYIWNCWQLHILALNVILNVDTFPCCKRKIYCFSSIIRKLHILRNIMYHMCHNTYLRLYMYIILYTCRLPENFIFYHDLRVHVYQQMKS